MKPYFFKPFLFACIVVVFNSCKEGNHSETVPVSGTETHAIKVDTQVVLQVGTERFTTFEIHKQLKMFRQKFYQTNHREATEDDIENWLKQFTQRAFVLADARAKGYYMRKDVNDEVEATAMLMISQPNGLLQKKLTESAAAKTTATGDAHKAGTTLTADYYSKIKKAAQVKLNTPAIIWLQSIINNDKQKNTLKPEALKGGLDKELATYHTPEGNSKRITVEDLSVFYNNLPLRRYLNDVAVVNEYINQIALAPYIKKEAEKMGVITDPEFKLNRKNFTDGVVYQKYMNDNLGADRGVKQADLLSVYSSVKQTLTHPTQVVYSLYTFSNEMAAYKALSQLRMGNNDTAVNVNALSIKRHLKFDKQNNHLPDTLKKIIYRAVPGQPLPPVKTNDYFTVVLVESASGREVYSPDEVKPHLITLAREKKELDYNALKATELSKRLKVEDDIDIKTLTNTKSILSL